MTSQSSALRVELSIRLESDSSSLRSAGTRSASRAASLGDRLQVESFVQELLFLCLRERGQSILVCEPIGALWRPRTEDDKAMPESSSLTLIVTEESPRVKSQAVRCKAAPS